MEVSQDMFNEILTKEESDIICALRKRASICGKNEVIDIRNIPELEVDKHFKEYENALNRLNKLQLVSDVKKSNNGELTARITSLGIIAAKLNVKPIK